MYSNYIDNEDDGIHFFWNRQLPILCVHGFGKCSWFGGSARDLSVSILQKHSFSPFLRRLCRKQDLTQWEIFERNFMYSYLSIVNSMLKECTIWTSGVNQCSSSYVLIGQSRNKQLLPVEHLLVVTLKLIFNNSFCYSAQNMFITSLFLNFLPLSLHTAVGCIWIWCTRLCSWAFWNPMKILFTGDVEFIFKALTMKMQCKWFI